MRKRIVSVMLATVLSCTSVLVGVDRNVIEVEAANYQAQVTINEDNKSVVIGNDYITRTFSMENNRLATTEFNNKRANLKFSPQEQSQDFIINTVLPENITYPDKLDKTGWIATASSQNSATVGGNDGPGQNLLDGNANTIWHTNYGGGTGSRTFPHSVTIDLKATKSFSCFSYMPRQDGASNGTIKNYKFYVSDTLEGLETAQPVASGAFNLSGGNRAYVNLDKSYSGRFVKLVAESAVNGDNFASGAEFDLHATKAPEVNTQIKASDLTIKNVSEVTVDGVIGKTVKFKFDTYNMNGIDWDIAMYVTMNDNDHYMRKFIEISVPDEQKDHARIDYIDLESMNVGEGTNQWTHPNKANGYGLSGYHLTLGQPVYIQGMFFGCEFPMTENEINSTKNAHIRYFSGKSFTKLEQDNQLTKDGKYVTWQTVAGAARSTDMNVIQTDLFDYIDDIAIKTDFRTQFNSWYDNMMFISDESVTKSFLEMEKGFTNSGVKPLDSYVVDDGWNNYNSSKHNSFDAGRSGTTQNTTGFWEFNTKFPQGFDNLGNLTHKFDSQFGVWLGPRGGYDFNGAMGHIVEDGGFGAYNAASNDIDVADRRYVKKLTEFLTEQQTRNKINYWKFDGFANRACNNTSHHHMTGGQNGMYYFSDSWESLTDMFETLRENAKENDIEKYWLNLTCFINPSPWTLQWGNSIWLQISGDIGRVNTGLADQVDQLLTYRDGTYFEFLKDRGFQFPAKNIYNHDPIYGVSSGLSNRLNDEQFRLYLYMMATRGTTFWELYYSPSMMNEGQKWTINAEFLKWQEQNMHILEHSKLLGERPDTGGGKAYGYSAWDKDTNEGIISMRNSSTTVKTMTYPIDNTIGVPEGIPTLKRTTVLNYKTTQTEESIGYSTIKYGDTITVTLQPGESRIWKFSENTDATAPAIENVKSLSENKVEIKLNEELDSTTVTDASFTIAGNTVTSVETRADFRSIHVTLGSDMVKNAVANVTINGIKDKAGNPIGNNTKVNIPYYEDDMVAFVTNKTNLRNGDDLVDTVLFQDVKGVDIKKKSYELNTTNSVKGKDGFTVSTFVRSMSKEANILKQEGGYNLAIDGSGKAVFTVGSKSVTSTSVVNDGNVKHIVGVRENNGMIKLYVNGALEASEYGTGMEEVKNGTITLGDEKYSGKIGNTVVYNKSFAYDEVEQLSLAIKQEEFTKIPQSKMTATANSEFPSTSGSGDGPANYAIDGKTSSWWHTNYNQSAGSNLPHWIQINLDTPTEISRFSYTPRTIGSNGNIKNYKIEVSADGTKFTQVAEGIFEDNGKIKNVDFPKQVVKAIKLTAHTGSYGQQPNKFASVVEINLYNENILKPVIDYSELAKAIEKGEKFKESDYSISQFAPLKDALKTAYTVFESAQDQGVVDAAVEALNNAINEIEKIVIVVDKTMLNNKIKEAQEKKAEDYTSESWTAFAKALEDAKKISTKVDATQAEVTASLEYLTEKMKELKPKEETSFTGWKTVDGKEVYYEKNVIKKNYWVKAGNTWFLTDGSGAKIKGAWQKNNNKWYLFASNGQMLTGWQKVGSKWYLLDGKSGAMKIGWQKEKGTWYLLDSKSGAMKTGWQKDAGKWYFLNKSGSMKTGWYKESGKWYHLKQSGAMSIGWVKVGAYWYYLNSSGVMQTGWKKDGKKTYYLKETTGAWSGAVK